MAGFLGRGLGAAAAGYLSGGVLGLQAQQRQREKDQDQLLRQAQIDSLNAQRAASRKDPNEDRRKVADAFLQQMLKDDFDPNMQSALRNTRGVKESRDAARRYISECYTNKRDWSEFDPTALSGIAQTIDQLRVAPQPGVPLGGEGAPPPLGAAAASANPFPTMSAPPTTAPNITFGAPGATPPPPFDLFGAPGAMRPTTTTVGVTPGVSGEKAGPAPAAPRPTKKAAPPTPEQLLAENNARAADYYRMVQEQEPTREQVAAEMPYETPKVQREEFDRRTDQWNRRLTQAAQQMQAWNKQAEGEAQARAAKPLADATLRQRLAAAGLAEAQIEQILNPQSLKNRTGEAGIEERRKRTQIAAQAEERQRNELEWRKRVKVIDQEIARKNAETSRQTSNTGVAAQKETAARNKRLNDHLDWLEKKGGLPLDLLEDLKNARAYGQSNRIKDSSGASVPGPPPSDPNLDITKVMVRVRDWLERNGMPTSSNSGGGAAPLGGGGGGGVSDEAVAAVAAYKAAGTLKATADRLRAQNDTTGLARLQAAVAEHDRRKKKK